MTEPTPPPIPVFQPHIGVDTIKSVVDALHAGWLGMGAITQAFEQGIARYLGLQGRHVLATNTGTSALHLGLLAAGVGPGDEVITPAFNFVADHQAIVATGAAPVLCDVEDVTLGLDPDKVAALVGPRTKAIVPLHFGGVAGRVKELYAVAERHRLRIVEDATHAFGTRVDGRPIGSFGDVTCFSFDPVKVITSIDGGAVIVGDNGDIDRLRHWRFLGIDRETLARYQNSRAWEYDVVSQGFRYHLTNINAAVGLSQLARVDEFIAGPARVLPSLQRAPGGRGRRARARHRLRGCLAVHLHGAGAAGPARAAHRSPAQPRNRHRHPLPARAGLLVPQGRAGAATSASPSA